MSNESEPKACPACGDVSGGDGARFCSKCAEPLAASVDAARPPLAAEAPSGGGCAAKSVVLRTYGKKPFGPEPELQLPPASAHRPVKREAELAQMLTALRARRAVLLRGGHGVGKTGLAAQATELLHAEGLFKDAIVWIDGVCDAPVAAVCDAVAAHMGNVEIPRLSSQDKLDAVYKLLDGRDLLVVLNFVKAHESAAAFAQHCPDDTALLVVSASPEAFEGFDESISLGPATPDDALAFFKSSTLNESAAREVCALLDNHPLALLYAAGFVKRSTEVLLGRLHDELGRIKARQGAGGEDEHLQVRAAFGVTTGKLAGVERRLLALLAASFDESVGVELLGLALGEEPARCAQLLERLTLLSLVEVEREGYFTLHPLLRGVLWQEWPAESRGAYAEMLLQAALRYVARHGEDDAERYDKMEAELGNLLGAVRFAHDARRWPEVVELAVSLIGVLRERNYWGELLDVGRLGIAAGEIAEDDKACARLLREMAATLKSQGEYDEARRMLARCVELGRRLDDPAQRADILHLRGQIDHAENADERAEGLYRQSLDIYKELRAPKGVAANLYQLGRIAQGRLDYKEAERLYEEALQLRRALGKDAQYEVAETLNSLALVHEKTGNYRRGEQRYKKALEIYRLSEQYQAHYAGCLHNLAGLYFAMGRYRKAEKNYQQALDIRRRLLGARHPDVAQSLNNLPAVYYARGSYTTAAPLWQQALDIYRVAFGEQHFYYAAVLGNLAGLYYVAGNYEAAEPLYKEALKIRRETLGERHPEVAQSLNNVAVLYGATGRHEEAAKYMEEATRINLELLGESHPLYADSLSNLALLYKEQGRFDRAEPLLLRALQIKRHAYRENHPDVAQTLHDLARLYEAMHNYPEAVSYMSEAVKIYRAALNDDHPYVAQSLTSLGLLYELLERYDEAAPLYRKAAEIYRGTAGEDHPDYVVTLNYLAELHSATRNYPAAAAAYQEILRVHRRNNRKDEQVAQALFSLGHLAHVQQKYDEAQSYFTESLEIKMKLVDRPGEAKILARLGFLKHRQRLYDEATEFYLRGLEISESLNKQGNVAQFLQLLGLTRTEQGRLDQARESFIKSLEIHRRLGAQRQVAENLRALSQLARRQGNEEEARQFEAEGQKISEQLGTVEALRTHISKPLDESQIRTLSSDLGVDYDDLMGQGKSVKLQELAATVYRQI